MEHHVLNVNFECNYLRQVYRHNPAVRSQLIGESKRKFETCNSIALWLHNQPDNSSTTIIRRGQNSESVVRIKFGRKIGDNLRPLFNVSNATSAAVQQHVTSALVADECHVIQSNNQLKINSESNGKPLMVNFLRDQCKTVTCMFYKKGSFITLSLLVFLMLHNSYTASTTQTSTKFQGISLAFGIIDDTHNFTNTTDHISINFTAIPASLLQTTTDFPNTDTVNKSTNIQTNTTRNLHSNIRKGLTFKNSKLSNIDESLKRTAEKVSSFCQSCQIFEIGKMNSLEFIKQQILMHLQLSHPPNVSGISSIPQRILDKFYNNIRNANVKTTALQSTQYGQNTQNIDISNNERSSLFDKAKSSYNYVSNTKQRLSFESLALDTNRDTYVDDDNSSYIKHGMQNDDSNQQVFSGHQYNVKLDGTASHIKNEYNSELKRNNFNADHYKFNSNAESLYSEELHSHLHSIYIFPKVLQSRNRKLEVYNFKFNKDTSTIAHTILHIYIRGIEWINIHKPHLLTDQMNSGKAGEPKELIILVYRILRRPNSINYTHSSKLLEVKYKIPSGLGQWIEVELKQLSTKWLINPNTTQSILIKGLQPWMQSLIVTNYSNGSKALGIHLEILINSKKRQRRSIHLDCFEGDNEVRCCRYPLKVNFKQFNWSFIIAPEIFDAYWCHGECKIGFLEQHPHTHVTTLTTSAKPCCSPRKMSSLSLLYLDHQNNLLYVTIPNMSIDKCGCA